MVRQAGGRGGGRFGVLKFEGRELAGRELDRIRCIVRARRGAARGELARAVCRELGWVRPNGALRLRACRDLVVRLAQAGKIRLPGPRGHGGGRVARASRQAPEEIEEDARAVQPVDLRRIAVRPIEVAELARWQEAMERYHYLGDGEIVGEAVRHVAEEGGRWLALIGWGAAALKIRHREAWIGWDAPTKYRRLHLVTNNVRFPRLGYRIWPRRCCRAARDD